MISIGPHVAAATITITNVANGHSQTLTAGEQGEFRVVALQPAPYRLVVEHPGFTRSERDLVLTVGSEATLEVRLTVAGVRETIEVTPASFDIAKSQPSSFVTSADIRTLCANCHGSLVNGEGIQAAIEASLEALQHKMGTVVTRTGQLKHLLGEREWRVTPRG